jgi:hypothetical protein
LSSNTAEEFVGHSKRLHEAYEKRRNDVVHGNANRTEEDWYPDAVRVSEEASRTVLFQYLYSIRQIRMLPAPTDRKRIRVWLTRLDEIAKQFRR